MQVVQFVNIVAMEDYSTMVCAQVNKPGAKSLKPYLPDWDGVGLRSFGTVTVVVLLVGLGAGLLIKLLSELWL